MVRDCVELVNDADRLAVGDDQKIVSRPVRVPIDALKIERSERNGGAGGHDLDGVAALASENGLVDQVTADTCEGVPIRVIAIAPEELVGAGAGGVYVGPFTGCHISKVVGLA